MSLIVTGTIGIDTVYTPAGEHREGVLGGSCAYFAAAASFYGPVRLVAAVGDDFPDEHQATLARFGRIDTAGLEIRAGSKTFRWGGKYLDNMDHRESLFTELNVLEEAPPAVPESFKDSEYVFLANMHPALQAELLSQVPSPKLAVADTMDLWIDVARDDLAKLLTKVDGLVLNYDEAEQYTGKKNPVTAGRALLDEGPTFVVVKKGEHGAILVHRDGVAALPAYPAEEVVDPTGAGDTFAGGMMGHLAATNPENPTDFDTLRRAMAHGTIIASFTIETFSLDRLAGLTGEQIGERYDEFASMVALR
ncbi:MAG: adenosine kinase [Phycisphaeraceae bacterium]|nr:MAG: adenosine kinase [Phycisphaeraceae bacterium]